jgi:D-hexose-6-phosphate mutarotase
LNTVLLKKYDQKTHLGETAETPEDLVLMKKYISENLSIKINGQKKTINFFSKEMETNVLVCYYNIKDISSIKTFEIQNTCLLDLNADQQNIIQTTFYGKKETLLLTPSTIKGFLKL